MSDIRQQAISSGVANLHESGHLGCDEKNILTHVVYAPMFRDMLKDSIDDPDVAKDPSVRGVLVELHNEAVKNIMVPEGTPIIDLESTTQSMPTKSTKTGAAKVASPKKPTKKAKTAAAVDGAVKEAIKSKDKPAAPKPAPAPKRSLEKIPYNFRTRSLARSIVDQIETPADKKTARHGMRDLRSHAEIREYFVKSIGNVGDFDSIVAAWFDNGTMKE